MSVAGSEMNSRKGGVHETHCFCDGFQAF